MKKENSILAIDWGSKYIWIAYKYDWTDVIMPIWYLMNDWAFFFSFSDILARYNVKKIVVWYPADQEDIQARIDNFIWQVSLFISEDVEILKENEDYSSTQAWEILWTFRKTESSDTIAAMKILENYSKNLKNLDI